jgi:hypothetical protein
MHTTQTFTYENVESELVEAPVSSFEQFNASCEKLITDFQIGNPILDLIKENKLTVAHYHSLLNVIFHQVYIAGSTTLALAGSMVEPHRFAIREFLFHHAEEEQNHWKWIIQDLRNTGFTGPDPRAQHPPFVTEAYRSFAMHFALKYPLESIAICYMLESLSSKLGVKYGMQAAIQLGLQREQMSFFLLHGELDQGHETEILDALLAANLTSEQWSVAEHAAKCTAHFYKEMYVYAAGRIER